MKKFSRDEPIETEAEHEAALKRIDQLMDATEGSPEAEELSDLADAVCLYENEHFSLDSKYEEIQKLIEQLGSILYNGFHSGDRKSFELVHRAYESLSSLLEENKRMKEAFGEVFFEWLHLHDVADSMDLAACVEIEDHEKFEAACHRARSALKEATDGSR